MNSPNEARQARVDAEAKLLAAILIDGGDGGHTVIDYCRPRLQPSDFLAEHQTIYQAMLKAQNPDHVTVALELKKAGQLKDGILSYLSEIIGTCESYRLYKYFVDAVKPGTSGPQVKGGISLD
jgi:replicative DNA helicase